MQALTALFWIFLRKGFFVRLLQVSVPICTSLTSGFAQKSAAQRACVVLHKLPNHGKCNHEHFGKWKFIVGDAGIQ
jgi:hypothetical protein